MKVKNDKIIIQVICALVAIGMWVLVMIDKNPLGDKTFYKIPVSVKNTDALTKGSTSYMLMENLDSFNVNVKVSGFHEDLLNLQAKDIKATAEITSFKEGSNSFVVEIEVPDKMEAKIVTPKYITCTVEEIVTVPVDVKVQYQGSQASGYYLQGYGISDPETVNVRGPRSIVNSVSSAVAIVNIEGMQENTAQNKPVILYDNTDKEIDTKLLTISPSSVKASYDIFPIKTVPVKPKYIGEPAEGYKLIEIASDVETIEIAAPKEILDTITELETEPLDISNANLNMMSEKKIITGKGINILANSNKSNVTATIEKIVEKEFIFNFDEIEFANKGDDFIISPAEENKSVTITVKATSTIMNKINKDNIKLVVDLIDAVEGSNNILLKVALDEEVEEITSDTETLGFVLERVQNEDNIDTDGGE